MITEGVEDCRKLSLSFSGCGFMCVYHAGVCVAIHDYAPALLKVPILGASAGSILGAFIVSGVCLPRAIGVVLDVVATARSFTFGALNRDFDLMQIVRRRLEAVLPQDAHKLCTGQLYISITRLSDLSNELVSEFSCREDLIDAIVCSCFIPLYCGFKYPKYKGEEYIDGGISVNQPILDYNTITITPFAGENDICPKDVDSANLLGLMFTGTSIRFTMSNLMRLLVSLFPTSPEACSKICQQGFEDAMRYLFRNGLSPCGSCLNIQASLLKSPQATSQDDAVTANEETNGSKHALRKSSTRRSLLNRKKSSECRLCLKLIDQMEEPPFARLFPHLIQQAFDDASKAKNEHKLSDNSFCIFRMVRTLMVPALIGSQLFRLWTSCVLWCLSYAVNECFLTHLKRVVVQLMRTNGTRSESEKKLRASGLRKKGTSVLPEDRKPRKPVFEIGGYEHVTEDSLSELAEEIYRLQQNPHTTSGYHEAMSESELQHFVS